MLSKKMAFSLTSLITIFALAFMVSPAVANKVTLKVADADPLKSGIQVVAATAAAVVTLETEELVLTTDIAGAILVVGTTFDPNADSAVGSIVADPAGEAGKKFMITLGPAAAGNVTVYVLANKLTSVPTGDKDNTAADITFTYIATADDLTSIDGAAAYPKVVSIQRLRPGSQTVVAAFQEAKITTDPFNVRIVLTDRPHKDDGKARDLELGDIDVQNGVASNLVVGVPFARRGQALDATPTEAQLESTILPHPIEGMYEHSGAATDGLAGVPEGMANSGNVPLPTGGQSNYHQYRVTITPHQKSADFTIKIRVKNFHDGASPVRNTYVSPGFDDSSTRPNGRDILSINVKGAARDLTAGYKVTIPKDWIIPANGYLIIAKSKSNSRIDTSGQDADRTNDTPRATHRTPAQLLYNVYETADLPNLSTQFLNGVVVDVVSQHAGLVVSEVMWGEDVSLIDRTGSQWIELYNPGDQYKTIDDKDETPDVNEALTLIFYRPNEFADIPAAGTDGSLPTGITDRIGTLDATGAYWSPATKGQNGASGIANVQPNGDIERTVAPTAIIPVVSMYRVMAADGTIDAMMGQMSGQWMSSQGPKSANFHPLALGLRHGTPGAATDSTVTPADTEAEAKAKADAEAAAAKAAADKEANTGTYPMQGDGRVYISEVMFAGGGTLPQWIEIANGDRSKEFNLSGWTITVNNATADADVAVSSAQFTIPNGTTISPSAQDDTPSTILVVTERGRNSFDGAMASEQVINLAEDNEIDLINAGILRGKYALLSDMAFEIILAPPVPAATKAPAGETSAAKAQRQAAEKKAASVRKAAIDTVGNLGDDGTAAWALPMDESGARSSIIRKHIQVTRGPAAPEDGMMAENWTLASNTSFAQVTHIRAQSYYGAPNDIGTPGFRAGGALPVELSHFRPARDKATGAAVITWATESELNNAGFFIKRSQQRNGEFKVINATMVPGAGTTSEKQFYTYTDTTAQPNVVYYYQIEDVSLDGNRQTLTRGIRLKGHVGAAGKATTLWGELKTSHE